jgi:hypothetical protein
MVGLLERVISPSQGLYLHRTTQHRKTRKNIHAFSGVRTHDPSNQLAKIHASDCTATVTGQCNFSIVNMLRGSLVTSCKAFRVLMLRMQKASRHGYHTHTHTHTHTHKALVDNRTDSPPAWGLGRGLTTYRRKKQACYEMPQTPSGFDMIKASVCHPGVRKFCLRGSRIELS